MGESNRFQMALMLCKAMIMFEKRCTLNTLALALTKKYVSYRVALLMMAHSTLYATAYMRIVRLCDITHYNAIQYTTLYYAILYYTTLHCVVRHLNSYPDLFYYFRFYDDPRVASIPYYASDGKWLSALEDEIFRLRSTLLTDLREHRYITFSACSTARTVQNSTV